MQTSNGSFFVYGPLGGLQEAGVGVPIRDRNLLKLEAVAEENLV
jgi:hypothetical protein